MSTDEYRTQTTERSIEIGTGVIQHSEKEVPVYTLGDKAFYEREEAEQYIEMYKLLLNRSYYLVHYLSEEEITTFSKKSIIGSDGIDKTEYTFPHYDEDKPPKYKLVGVKNFSSFSEFAEFLDNWEPGNMTYREKRRYSRVILPDDEDSKGVGFWYIRYLARLEKEINLPHSELEILEGTTIRDCFTAHSQEFFSLEEAKRHVKFVKDLVERDKAKFSNCRC